jgi:cytidylate kinase
MASDAVLIDTTGMPIPEVVARVMGLVAARVQRSS